MNCENLRRELLLRENPDHPGNDARLHLQACRACRRWQTQLLAAESAIRHVTVPSSTTCLQVVRQFLADPKSSSYITRRSVEQPLHWLVRLSPTTAWTWWHEHDAHWRSLASGFLAAGLLFITLVILLWGPDDDRRTVEVKKKPISDPFLAKLFDRDVRLASARTPSSRLEILTDLADDLQTQTRAAASAADLDDLLQLAKLYEQVLNEGVIAGAKKLPAAQRQTVLVPIADRLLRIGTEAEQLAGRLPGAAASPLRQIAAASRHVDDQLRAFVMEVPS